MRRHRADQLQTEIINYLRNIMDCSVLVLSQVGGGCPDLLIGRGGQLMLMEIKAEKGRHRELNPEQLRWHRAWRGRKPVVVRSLEEARDAVNNLTLEKFDGNRYAGGTLG